MGLLGELVRLPIKDGIMPYNGLLSELTLYEDVSARKRELVSMKQVDGNENK